MSKTVKALRMRIIPNPEQKKKIDTTINCCRFIRNHMIERNNKIYKRRGEHLNYNAMQNLLPEMKKYRPWLKEADSQALKYACRQVDNAYTRFFKKAWRISKIQQQTSSKTKLYNHKRKINTSAKRKSKNTMRWMAA